MHKLGCPKRNNPYADCECAAIDQREHTEQLRQFNESAQREQQNRESVPIESTKPVIKFAFVLGLITGLGLGSGLTFLAVRPSPEQVKRAQLERQKAAIQIMKATLDGFNTTLERQLTNDTSQVPR